MVNIENDSTIYLKVLKTIETGKATRFVPDVGLMLLYVKSLYSPCAKLQSHVIRCQICKIFARHVSKVKGRYGKSTILQFRLFRNDPTIKTYFTVIIIMCGISLDKKNVLYNNMKSVFTNESKYYWSSTRNLLSYEVFYFVIIECIL